MRFMKLPHPVHRRGGRGEACSGKGVCHKPWVGDSTWLFIIILYLRVRSGRHARGPGGLGDEYKSEAVLTGFFSFQLCGCGLLGVGIWLSVSQGNFATFSPSFPSLSAANLVIAIGTIVMVTGFLGCLGAIKENKCLLLSVS